MTYYRLAIKDRQTANWTWKTTVLTSLESVFQLLRRSAALPQDRIRVFKASSKEDLQEMLRRENQHQTSGSVTAAQFLGERNILVRGQAQRVSEQPGTGSEVRQVAVATLPSRSYLAAPEQPVNAGMSSLDKKRLELELGAGGDHDIPYTFTLPTYMPQVVAWIKLMAKFQGGA